MTLAAVTTPAAAAVRCAPGINEFNRTQECWVKRIPLVFVKANGDVGVSLLVITQYIALNPNSSTLHPGRSTWTELDTVTGLIPLFGDTAPVRIKLMASCAAPCHAKAHFEGVAEVGLQGTVDYTDDVKEGMFNTTSTSYRLLGHAPGFFPFHHLPPWNSLVSYRCDNGLATTGTGCVIPKFVPTLKLSLKKYGASADMIRWAQRNMKAHWGWRGHGKALRREADDNVAIKNRAKVCQDGTFINLGRVIGGPGDSDSCDEFPFAKTKESGASKLGKPPFLNGASCAQVEAVKSRHPKGKTEALLWPTVEVLGKPDLSAPCVRGHIPGRLNSGVGGAYGSFVKNQRLIDLQKGEEVVILDPFWVAVTS